MHSLGHIHIMCMSLVCVFVWTRQYMSEYVHSYFNAIYSDTLVTAIYKSFLYTCLHL